MNLVSLAFLSTFHIEKNSIITVIVTKQKMSMSYLLMTAKSRNKASIMSLCFRKRTKSK